MPEILDNSKYRAFSPATLRRLSYDFAPRACARGYFVSSPAGIKPSQKLTESRLVSSKAPAGRRHQFIQPSQRATDSSLGRAHRSLGVVGRKPVDRHNTSSKAPAGRRHSPRGSFTFASIAILFSTLMLTSGCSDKKKNTDNEITPPRIENISVGKADITITADPGEVYLNRDMVLTLHAEAPRQTEVTFPPIEDRLTGFVIEGSFDRESTVNEDGIRTTERVIRLTPTISDEYRIAPMAVTCLDKSTTPPTKTWTATPPLKFDLHNITDNSVGAKITDNLQPVWIRPPMQTIAGYVALVFLAIFALFLLSKLARRVQRQVRLMRMSPRERALEELRELLNKKLIEKHRIKDFYVELTMVVRRYIERQHRVRAPEQTTEEFLNEISANPRFTPEVIRRLRSFLQAADLVKFAAHTPDDNNNRNAIETAKEYISSDAEQAEREKAQNNSDRRK